MQEHYAQLLIRDTILTLLSPFSSQFKIVVAGDSSCCSVMVAVMMVRCLLMVRMILGFTFNRLSVVTFLPSLFFVSGS